ncbi:hypothetical protein [Flavobacterium sp. TAB 87]|uniref:hypothetical protein n=1 Tax=Flavobacterium sp. TAB 87 TaxID=1729581 RepID=UPI0012F946E5|nr:hypothetical protein [Flavobacterium sp. TAB 87]
MRNRRIAIVFISIFILVFLESCQSKTYLFTNNNYKTGVDFTQGKWLLNQIDCNCDSNDEIKEQATLFFAKNLTDRYYYRPEINGLLLPHLIPLNPSKQKIKELKIGTNFDFFINVTAKENRSDLGKIGFYEDENSTGKNQSEVTLEVYDLNLQEIIYSQRVVGTVTSEKQKSLWETTKSDKLIDNISFHKSNKKLIKGAFKKLLKDLEKKSVLIK